MTVSSPQTITSHITIPASSERAAETLLKVRLRQVQRLPGVEIGVYTLVDERDKRAIKDYVYTLQYTIEGPYPQLASMTVEHVLQGMY